jgi:acetylglutamate kinase
LYYCFEKKGVLLDVTDEDSLVENINQKKYDAFIEKEIIAEGMLPKLNNCFYAIHQKVQKVSIGKPDMLYNQNAKFTKIEAS